MHESLQYLIDNQLPIYVPYHWGFLKFFIEREPYMSPKERSEWEHIKELLTYDEELRL